MLLWATTMINMAREIWALEVTDEIHLTAVETVAETKEETTVTIENIEMIEVEVQEDKTIVMAVEKGKTTTTIEGDIDLTLTTQMGRVAHTTEAKIEENKIAAIEIEEVHTMETKTSLITIKETSETKEKDQNQIDEMSYNVLFVINQLKGLNRI